jgi:hypothetical protein
MDDIQLARYDRVFNGYAGSDEYLSRDSFARHTRRLAEIRGVPADSPSIAALDEELGQTWNALAAMADTDNDGRVSRDEWRASCEVITSMLREAQAAGGPLPFESWAQLLYRVIDADSDGCITKQEYADWLSALGLAEDTDLDAAFGGFDTNADGHLSVDEFLACYFQFWSDFDASVPGHRWIGP